MDFLAKIHEDVAKPGDPSEEPSISVANTNTNFHRGGHSRELSQLSSALQIRDSAEFRARPARENPETATSRDPISTFFENLVYCCDQQTDIDIYHVAALRRLDEDSRAREIIPCKNIGSFAICIPKLSRYHENLCITIIVAILQVFGITVILASEMHNYFVSDSNDSDCDYEAIHWTLEGTSFKILALLWALFITLYVLRSIHSQRHSGLYELLTSVQCKDYHRLAFIDIGWVYFGLFTNIYTLFCACIGSFFLIYATESGGDAMDMVMNAIALFFMLDVDNLLVVDTDYVMLRKILENLTRANEVAKIKWDDDQIDVILNGTYGDHDILAYGENMDNSCLSVHTFQMLNNVLNIFVIAVELFTVLVGIVGPFALLICW